MRHVWVAALLLLAGLAGAVEAPRKGYLLEREGRSRILLVEEAELPSLPLKEALLFAGAAVTWQERSRCVLIEYQGATLRMALYHPWVYLSANRREPLPGGFTLSGGRPVLDVESLEALFKAMGAAGPGVPDRLAIRLRPARSFELTPTPGPAEEQAIVVQTPVAAEPRVATPEPKAAAAEPARKPQAVRRIVIDPGHGGFDSGAIGSRKSYEKTACLDIGLRLRDELRRRLPGVRVLMTRDKDVFVELKERTHFANKLDADLFISIHANSSPKRSSRGTQVFFYDSQSSNRDAEVLARSENEDANYLDIMLTDLSKAAVRDQSIALAMKMEAELVRSLGLKGRRLQYAPFYVLAKTKMPAVLVETAFISNPQEEALLKDPAWRGRMAKALATGVVARIKEMAE